MTHKQREMTIESAKRLAAAGATIVMTTRTAEKGDIAKKQVESSIRQIN